MTAIDYEKYEDMTKKEIAKSLQKAQKRVQNFSLKIQQEAKLIKYLKSKIKKTPKNNKYDFVSLEKSGLIELQKEVEKQFSPQELKQIKQELQEEINRDYDNDA
ncbi:hypothetical protein [Helicobacter sp. T3_23-1056]